MIRKPLVHDHDALRALPSYAMVPAIVAAAEVCNSGELIGGDDATEAVDGFKLRALRAALTALHYEYGMVVGR
jgi:hypothetical protein